MYGWLEKDSDLLAKITVFNTFASNLNEYEHKSKPRYNVIKGRHDTIKRSLTFAIKLQHTMCISHFNVRQKSKLFAKED